MIKNITLLFLFLHALFAGASYGQDRENKILEINFNDERGSLSFKLNDTKIADSTINIDLRHDDLEIRLTKYKKQHLLKLILEDTLGCEGLEKFTDSSTRNTKITINNGKLNLGQNFIVGSKIKIALPNDKKGLAIITHLDTLTKCPDTAATAIASTTAVIKNDKGLKVGIPYYDALYLAGETDIEKKKQILQYYVGLADSLVDCNRILDSLKNNLFLLDFANRICVERAKAAGKQATGSFASLSSFSSIGGLDVTNIADGVAKFLVKRAKQELSIAFFQRFKSVIDSTKDIATLFPETTNLLDAIDEQIYNYATYLQNLREAFKKDIKLIHRNLPGIIDNHPAFFRDNKDLKGTLLSACYIAEGLENQAHPGDIVANYPTEYLDSINLNYKGAIQTIQLLSASLRDTSTADTAAYWVNIKQIRDLVNNKEVFKIYLGLIYQEATNKYGSVQFKDNTLIQYFDIVAKTYDNGQNVYSSYKNYVLKFGEKLTALNKMVKEYSKPVTDSAALEQYAKYFRASVDMIEYCTEISRLPVIKTFIPELPVLLRPYFNVAYSTTDLVIDISQKNYSSAINHAVHIYKLVTKNQPDLSNTVQNLIKYGSFMATVATAKSSNEVEAAVEAAALPVGSARIKRESRWNVSLNAYVGLFVGYEEIKGVDSGRAKFNSFGVTAPIGIAISYGGIKNSQKKSRGGKSISAFITLVDLGAVTAYRFTNDSAQKIPTIQLEDLVSPGLLFSFGFGKIPLSLNAGYQFGPLLRKVNLEENTYGKYYHRFSLSLNVDIPIFNFYSSPVKDKI